MRDLRPALRAPLLGLGLGLVGGGFEAVKLASTMKLSLSFGQAAGLCFATAALNGLFAVLLAIPVGLLVDPISRRWFEPRRYAACMGATAFLLGCWYMGHAAIDLLDRDRALAAAAYGLLPIGIAGVVHVNAVYWFRRDEIEERRLGWWFWSALGASVLALGSAWWASRNQAPKAIVLDDDPAVVLISVDTLRQDHVSAYGRSPVQTPHIDALAARGALMGDAITPLPETAPAHSALFTGRHPARSGMLSNAGKLARGYTTLAERLQDEGYMTGAFVSSFAVDSRTGLDQGFAVYDDDFFPWVRGLSEMLLVRFALRATMRFGDPLTIPFLLERPAPGTIERALGWMGRNRDRPFLAWVHLFEPHAPYEPHGMPGFEDNGTPEAPALDHRDILAHEADFEYTDEVRERLRRLYAEEVAYTDQQIGVLLAGIEALALERPVIFVLVGDHGESLGEHGFEMNHHGLYEEVVAVPMIVVPHVPDVARRPVVDAQVRLMDVPATIVSLLGLDPLDKTDGVDLRRYMTGAQDVPISSLLVGRRSGALDRGLLLGYRAGNVKYILDKDANTDELYDLGADPDEADDLSASQQETVQQARARVQGEAGSLVVGAPDARGADLQALKSLGYAE